MLFRNDRYVLGSGDNNCDSSTNVRVRSFTCCQNSVAAALLVCAFVGFTSPASAAGTTQTRTIDTAQHFAGIFFHGAPVFVPDPAAPPGAGAFIDDHKAVFGPGANWVQDTLFSASRFRGQTSAAGATEIRHQIAPHGEAPTGVKLLGVGTAQQVFPLPGLPGFSLGIDVKRKAFGHAGHTDTYGMLILAGFRGNNLTGYLGFLAGAHTVPVKRSLFAPLVPEEDYVFKGADAVPPFGGVVISLSDRPEKEETDLVLIAATGVPADALRGVSLYSGNFEDRGERIAFWDASAFSSDGDQLGVALTEEINLGPEVAPLGDGAAGFLALETSYGTLSGQLRELRGTAESICPDCDSGEDVLPIRK